MSETTLEADPIERPRSSVVGRASAIGCLIALVALVGSLLFAGQAEHHYRLLFENAGQLVPDNQVQIGGVPVGSVDDIELTADGVAEVSISLDQELHEGTSAVIRATSFVGIANRYVSISPGADNAPALEDGATLGLTATTAPVDLDQVLNAFTPKTRKGLSNFIKGQAGVYEGKGSEANASYRYLHPALFQTKAFLDQLNADQVMLESFITESAKVFNTLAASRGDLSSSVANANQALGAIASENESLDQTLQRIPDTFRQSNTAFVNLRAALDDLDSLVETAKPATVDLAPFLGQARPVLEEAIPFFRRLGQTLSAPGPENDLAELTSILPEVEGRANPAFGRARRAIDDFQPTLDMARAYSPEMLNALAKLGQITGYYDADGHYARTALADLNLFAFDGASNQLEPAAAADQFAPFGSERFLKRCPGGASSPAADNSSPFYDPPWPESGLSGSECDPDQVAPGP